MEWLHAEGAMDCLLQVRGAVIAALALAVAVAVLVTF
jgi:hypothetical protein